MPGPAPRAPVALTRSWPPVLGLGPLSAEWEHLIRTASFFSTAAGKPRASSDPVPGNQGTGLVCPSRDPAPSHWEPCPWALWKIEPKTKGASNSSFLLTAARLRPQALMRAGGEGSMPQELPVWRGKLTRGMHRGGAGHV